MFFVGFNQANKDRLEAVFIFSFLKIIQQILPLPENLRLRFSLRKLLG
jgi:hypothetical protein